MKPRIISFSGYQGSGKDTFADYLCKEYNYKRLAFADTMKDMCSRYYKVPRHYFDDRTLKETIYPEHGITPRDMCINLGSYMRSIDDNTFINAVISQIELGCNYVISDCRKLQERDTLREKFNNNYISVYIKRFTDAPSNHPLEHEIKPWHCDYVLDNTNSPVNFKKLDEFLNVYKN